MKKNGKSAVCRIVSVMIVIASVFALSSCAKSAPAESLYSFSCIDGVLTLYPAAEGETMQNIIHACEPHTIIIADGISKIEDGAFAGLRSVRKVVLSQSVSYIGKEAFRECENLEEVNIPHNVTVIGSRAFMGCISLTQMTMPKNLTRAGAEMFKGCTNLTAFSRV